MEILIVEDEPIVLRGSERQIRKAAPDAEVRAFLGPDDALDHARRRPPDVAFLDIELRSGSGLDLAEELRRISPGTNIVYVTSYPQYMGQAWEQHASGYVLKPLTAEKAGRELAWLRRPPRPRIATPRIAARTFGDFEVFVDGRPLRFRYRKTKELLARLIDRRGAMCSMGELSAVLWDEDERAHGSYLQNLRKDLSDTLGEQGLGSALLRGRGTIGVSTAEIDCDLWRALEGDRDAAASYHGEYMFQYSWAEETNAYLTARFGLDGIGGEETAG